MSTRKRKSRESGQHQFLADDYAAIAKELEAAGSKAVASVFRKRAAHHRKEADE